jgi:hypothetical protein
MTLSLDLANGSGQSGSGSTHAGSGQMGSGKKTGRPKWVAQPMTLTRSFKGLKNENKFDHILLNYHLVFFVFLSIQIREHINKNTHK